MIPQYLRDHGVDFILGIIGTAAAGVAFTIEPLMIAIPAVIVMVVTGTVMVHRNSGDGGEQR